MTSQTCLYVSEMRRRYRENSWLDTGSPKLYWFKIFQKLNAFKKTTDRTKNIKAVLLRKGYVPGRVRLNQNRFLSWFCVIVEKKRSNNAIYFNLCTLLCNNSQNLTWTNEFLYRTYYIDCYYLEYKRSHVTIWLKITCYIIG